MVEQLLNHLARHKLCSIADKVLLAVSGGIDSMVMLHLFRQAGFSIGVAHVNFMLRGDASLNDERLVRAYCEKHHIPFFSTTVDTKAYAASNGVSIQVAARELRYSFFEEMCAQRKYDCIATAHHLNDNLETVLLNLIRGTGIDGLTGIPVKKNKVVRPMLFATRKMIAEYAVQHGVEWREDESNTSDDYTRNFIRRHIFPLLKDINPSIESSFGDTWERMNGARHLMGVGLEQLKGHLWTENFDGVRIRKSAVAAHEWSSVVLWEMIKPFGFTYAQCTDITATHQAGKIFFTATHRLVVDRQEYLISKRAHNEIEPVIIGKDDQEVTAGPELMKFSTLPRTMFSLDLSPEVAQLDLREISFPLIWRPWKQGDYFQPLGMQQRKKVSDFLIDLKVPLPEKEKVTVLESAKGIVWVVGYRIGDLFKITEHTSEVMKIEWQRVGQKR
jgi:tRNA(Ile)-lysidine synthase